MIHRRNFLLGLGVAIAAPAIVKAGSLMKLPTKRLLTPAEIVQAALDMIGQGNLYGRSPMMDVLPLLREQRVWIGMVGGQIVHTVTSRGPAGAHLECTRHGQRSSSGI